MSEEAQVRTNKDLANLATFPSDPAEPRELLDKLCERQLCSDHKLRCKSLCKVGESLLAM